MIELLIAGVYTIVIASGSAYIGYIVGTKQFQQIVQSRIDSVRIKRNPAVYAGAVKQKTPQQLEYDKDKVGQRIEELLSDEDDRDI